MIPSNAITFRRRFAGLGAAVGVTLAMNGMILWALAHLNHPPQIEPDRPPETRVTMLAEREVQQAPRNQDTAEPEQAEPEPMEVDFQPPQPRQIDRPELTQPVDSPVVPVTPVQVAVAENPQPPAQPAPQPSSASESRSEPSQSAAAAGPLNEDEVDEPPRPVSVPDPKYPRTAERRRIGGAVTVRVLINERGRVEDAEIVEVAGHPSFEGAVLDAVDRWRFSAARHGGEAVKVWGVLTINFQPD